VSGVQLLTPLLLIFLASMLWMQADEREVIAP
jgi:hypothetical protein